LAKPVKIASPKLVDGNWIARPENTHQITIREHFNRDKIIGDFFKTMENYVLVNKPDRY
jgi:hypothetical protein